MQPNAEFLNYSRKKAFMVSGKIVPVRLNESVLPASIYGDTPYLTTPFATTLSRTVQDEVSCLLAALLMQTGAAEMGTYFRIDAYLDPTHGSGRLSILEVTTQYVDGWGIALNLSRAAGRRPQLAPVDFPRLWVLDNSRYRSEIELDVREITLATNGELAPRVIDAEEYVTNELAYWYGWKAPEGEQILPSRGRFLEDKRHLYELAKTWQGEQVYIPSLYMIDETPWDALPFPVVCKNRRKNVGIYGNVALCRSRADTGKYARRAYERGEAVAQVYSHPFLLQDRYPTQLEILCIGIKPTTGYLLVGDPDTFVLNDRAKHGPLFLL